MIDQQVLRRLARETGRLLGELGVRPEDEKWILIHAETIARLGSERRRTRLPRILYWLARKAARMAR
jgi:hypothetical protein